METTKGRIHRLALAAVSIALGGRMQAQDRIWFIDSDDAAEAIGHARTGPDIDGDGLEDLLISTLGGDCSNPAGYVSIVSTTGTELHRWCGYDPTSNFGAAVWVGDVDGLGLPDVAIGETHYYDPVQFGRDTGRVQVYSSESKALLYEIIGTQMDGRFGVPLDRVDDMNGDGIDDLLVGAPSYGPTGEGRAWVFSMKNGKQLWTRAGGFQARFGHRVVRLRDVDGDSVDDFAVTAERSNVGRVTAYSGSSGTALRQFDGVTGTSDSLGRSISAPADLDGDGLADIVLGAYGATGDGHLDAYSVATGNLIWTIPGFSPKEWFGEYSCAVGDIDGDGADDFLVTASWDDHDGKDVGRVDLISGRSHRSLYRFYAGLEGLFQYGTVLTRGADFDGDGIEDLIIGTYYGGKYQSQGGHVAIYAGNDLFLQADPLAPAVNDTVTVDLRGGEPSTLGLVALTAIDGVPLFAPLLVSAFDANGEIQLLADVDPAVSGHDFTILGFAMNRSGRGPLMDSSPQTVSVQ